MYLSRSTGSTWRLILVVFLALLLVAGTVTRSGGVAADEQDEAAQPAQAVQLSGDDAVVAAAATSDMISSDAQGVQVAASRPWTVEEMRAAQPHPGASVADAGQASNDLPAVTGTPGKAAGGLPSGTVGTAGEGETGPATTVGTAGYSYPAPYTGFEVFTPYTQYPYSAMGKLFFTQGGSRFVCSASSIGNYGIFTAGHCAYAPGKGWSTNVQFVPAYRDGAAPRGVYAVSRLSVYNRWAVNGDLRWDYAGGVARPGSAGFACAGVKVSACVGWLGFAWNQGYVQHWNAFGYSAESPFNGQRLRACQASHAYLLGFGSVGPLTHAIGCNQNGGSSGGPWVLAFGTGNYLNGVNSYTRVSNGVRFKEMASPYFDANTANMRNWAVTALP